MCGWRILCIDLIRHASEAEPYGIELLPFYRYDSKSRRRLSQRHADGARHDLRKRPIYATGVPVIVPGEDIANPCFLE